MHEDKQEALSLSRYTWTKGNSEGREAYPSERPHSLKPRRKQFGNLSRFIRTYIKSCHIIYWLWWEILIVFSIQVLSISTYLIREHIGHSWTCLFLPDPYFCVKQFPQQIQLFSSAFRKVFMIHIPKHSSCKINLLIDVSASVHCTISILGSAY